MTFSTQSVVYIYVFFFHYVTAFGFYHYFIYYGQAILMLSKNRCKMVFPHMYDRLAQKLIKKLSFVILSNHPYPYQFVCLILLNYYYELQNYWVYLYCQIECLYHNMIKAERYWNYGYFFQYRRTSAILTFLHRLWLADTNTIPTSHSGLSWEELNLQTIFVNF